MRRSNSNATIALTTALLCASLGLSSAAADSGVVIEDQDGNPFMEEVVDENQYKKEKQRLTGKKPLNRRLLTPEELRNVGVQLAPSGAIIPLINRDPNAPLVRKNSSRIEAYNEPWWNFIPRTPWGTPIYANPLVGVPRTVRPGMLNRATMPFAQPGIIPRRMYRGLVPGVNIGLGAPLGAIGSSSVAGFGALGGLGNFGLAGGPFGVTGFGNIGGISAGGSIGLGGLGGINRFGTSFPSRGFAGSGILGAPFGTAGGIFGAGRVGGLGGGIFLPGTTTFQSSSTITPLIPSFASP